MINRNRNANANYFLETESGTYSYMDNSELKVWIWGPDDRCHNKANQRARYCAYNNIYWNIPPANMKILRY